MPGISEFFKDCRETEIRLLRLDVCGNLKRGSASQWHLIVEIPQAPLLFFHASGNWLSHLHGALQILKIGNIASNVEKVDVRSIPQTSTIPRGISLSYQLNVRKLSFGVETWKEANWEMHSKLSSSSNFINLPSVQVCSWWFLRKRWEVAP